MVKKNEIFPMDAVSILLSELAVQSAQFKSGVEQARHSGQVIASIRAVLDQYEKDQVEHLIFGDYSEDSDTLLDALEMDVSQVNVLESAAMPEVTKAEIEELHEYKKAWHLLEQYLIERVKDKASGFYLEPVLVRMNDMMDDFLGE